MVLSLPSRQPIARCGAINKIGLFDVIEGGVLAVDDFTHASPIPPGLLRPCYVPASLLLAVSILTLTHHSYIGYT